MQTVEIKGIRNNKEITLTVEVKSCHGEPLWVRKENGKPLYSTTGYIKKFNGVYSIGTYRGKTLMTDVTGFEALEGFKKITEQNRELWIDGTPPEAI
jgi:hypothetical protein